ncbi:hypothetical protein MRX96_016015 [Rhipicephalus microplus]
MTSTAMATVDLPRAYDGAIDPECVSVWWLRRFMRVNGTRPEHVHAAVDRPAGVCVIRPGTLLAGLPFPANRRGSALRNGIAASTLIVAPQHVTGVARFFPVQHGGLSWISSN